MQLPDTTRARSQPPRYGNPIRYTKVVADRAEAVEAAPRQDVFELLHKIWRHRWLVFGSGIVLAFLGAVVAFSLPAYYTGEAMVLIGQPQQRILSVDTPVTDIPADAERVESERVALQSRVLAKQVVAQLHLMNNPDLNPTLAPVPGWKRAIAPVLGLPARIEGWLGRTVPSQAAANAGGENKTIEDKTIDALLANIDVSVVGRSHVLDIAAQARQPELAAAIANTLANDYLAQQRQDKIASSQRIDQYLDGRIAQLRQQVEKSEQAAADYRRENGLYEVDKGSLNSAALATENTQLIQAQTTKAQADAALHDAMQLQKGGDQAVPAVLSSPLIQALKEREAEAARNLAQLSTNYGPRYPSVVQAKAQLDNIRGKLGAEIGHVVAGLRNEARTADARYAALERNFNNAKTQMGGANEKDIHLQALLRDAAVNRKLLDAMMSRVTATVGRADVEQPDAKLLSPAAPPTAPSFPPKTLIVFLALLGGLLAGVVAAVLRDRADQSFRRADEIEAAVNLPVTALVPSLAGSIAPAVHVLRNPVSPYSEALRRIYVGLQLSESMQAPKTAMFCSAEPSEGKSVMVASLGRLLASNGKRVMLLDCDWRCPTLHRIFQCPNRNGLAALLSDSRVGLSEVVHNDPLSGLDLIVSGGWTPQSMHTLTSNRMRTILDTFARNYDLVIIDSPPVLVGAEVLTLSRMVDKVMFVVRWGHTRRDAVIDAVKQLSDAQADVPGVVLSRVDPERYRQFAYNTLNYDYARPTFSRAS